MNLDWKVFDLVVFYLHKFVGVFQVKNLVLLSISLYMSLCLKCLDYVNLINLNILQGFPKMCMSIYSKVVCDSCLSEAHAANFSFC